MARRWTGYFKHWNDASQGDSIQSLIGEKRYDCVTAYWILLELANQKNSGTFEIDKQRLRRILNMTCPKVDRVLLKFCSTFNDFSYKDLGKSWSISFGNYAYFQETRGQKKGKKGAEPSDIKDNKIKDTINSSKTPHPSELFEIEKTYPEEISKIKIGLENCYSVINRKPPPYITNQASLIFLKSNKDLNAIASTLQAIENMPSLKEMDGGHAFNTIGSKIKQWLDMGV